MDDILIRTYHQLLERSAGPFHFRFILQPLSAALIAVRAGRKDAGTNQTAYLWAVLSEPVERGALIRSAWKDIARLFILGVVLDAIYQLIMFHWFYPLQTVIVACALAVAPYVVIRGPVARLTRFLNLRRKR